MDADGGQEGDILKGSDPLGRVIAYRVLRRMSGPRRGLCAVGGGGGENITSRRNLPLPTRLLPAVVEIACRALDGRALIRLVAIGHRHAFAAGMFVTLRALRIDGAEAVPAEGPHCDDVIHGKVPPLCGSREDRLPSSSRYIRGSWKLGNDGEADSVPAFGGEPALHCSKMI